MLLLFLLVGLVMAFVLATLAALGTVMVLREASRDVVSRIECHAYLRRPAALAFRDEITPAAAPDGRGDEGSPDG